MFNKLLEFLGFKNKQNCSTEEELIELAGRILQTEREFAEIKNKEYRIVYCEKCNIAIDREFKKEEVYLISFCGKYFRLCKTCYENIQEKYKKS